MVFDITFQQLADLLLLQPMADVKMDSDALFIATEQERFLALGVTDKDVLTDQQKSYLASYQLKFPNRTMFDLSRYPDADRGRSSNRQDLAPCFATSSGRLWRRS